MKTNEMKEEAGEKDETVPGGMDHDCGCEVCEERGEKLAGMTGEAPEEKAPGKTAHGGPGLMVVIGGGSPEKSARREKFLEKLAKK